jgi:hypothetical protein
MDKDGRGDGCGPIGTLVIADGKLYGSDWIYDRGLFAEDRKISEKLIRITPIIAGTSMPINNVCSIKKSYVIHIK